MNYFNAYTVSQVANNFASLLIPAFRNKMDLCNLYCYMFQSVSMLPESAPCSLQSICWSAPGLHNVVLQRWKKPANISWQKKNLPFWNVKANLSNDYKIYEQFNSNRL